MTSNTIRITGKKQKSLDGILRIPKTFVFDQNLPKEDYLKYISPENIIPESVEIASQVFSSYRRKPGSQHMGRITKAEITKNIRNKSSVPAFEPHKHAGSRESSPHKSDKGCEDGLNRSRAVDEVIEAVRRTPEKPKISDILHDNVNETKGHATSFSMSQMHDLIDRPQTSPNKNHVGKSIEESPNQSKLASSPPQARNNSMETIQVASHAATQSQFFKANENTMNKLQTVRRKKKKVTEKDYKISELDTTQDIVRKTDLAVRTLLQKGEKVKRDVRNFEETIKTKLKENQRVPIDSIRAVSLVKDFVFNDEEFERLLEEDEEQDKVHRKTFSHFPAFKEKGRLNSLNLKNVESRIRHLQTQSSSKFSPPKKPSTAAIESIVITDAEKKAMQKELQKQLAQKTEELQRQLEAQVRIHEDYKIFSNEKNNFRISTLNYTKLIKEKEKIKTRLLRDLKTIKYKEREAQGQATLSHRVRSTDRGLQADAQSPKDYTKTLGDSRKEEPKMTSLFRITEVLTKPIKDNSGSKLSDLKTHMGRLDNLKKKKALSGIERVSTVSYQYL